MASSLINLEASHLKAIFLMSWSAVISRNSLLTRSGSLANFRPRTIMPGLRNKIFVISNTELRPWYASPHRITKPLSKIVYTRSNSGGDASIGGLTILALSTWLEDGTRGFKDISEELKIFDANSICSTIIGGDFNVTLDQDLDGSGGINKRKEAVKFVEDICVDYDLLDIWRLRNPLVKRFTWRQKNPIIQRRLDFWLVSNDLQEDIESVDILPSIKSDHSAIVLSINGIDENNRGPNVWKSNASLGYF